MSGGASSCFVTACCEYCRWWWQKYWLHFIDKLIPMMWLILPRLAYSGTLHAPTQTKEVNDILHRNLIFDLDPRSQAHFIDKLVMIICLILLRLRRSLVSSSPEEQLSDVGLMKTEILLLTTDDVTNPASPCLFWNTTYTCTNEIDEILAQESSIWLGPEVASAFYR